MTIGHLVHTILKSVTAVLGAVALADCGGGGGNSTPTHYATNIMAGGIWHGTLTQNGQTTPLLGLISESGDSQFVQSPGVTPGAIIYPGTFLGIDGGNTYNSLSYAYIVGQSSQAVPVVVNATVDPRTRITGTIANTHGINDSFTFDDYDAAAYEQPSSLAMIAGNYFGCGSCVAVGGATPGISVTIYTNGTLTGYIPAGNTSYPIQGTVSVPNAAYNLYGVQFFEQIQQGGVTNDYSFSGVATYTPAANGQVAQLTLIVTAGNAGGAYWVLTPQ